MRNCGHDFGTVLLATGPGCVKRLAADKAHGREKNHDNVGTGTEILHGRPLYCRNLYGGDSPALRLVTFRPDMARMGSNHSKRSVRLELAGRWVSKGNVPGAKRSD